jgi:hypothetical protein
LRYQVRPKAFISDEAYHHGGEWFLRGCRDLGAPDFAALLAIVALALSSIAVAAGLVEERMGLEVEWIFNTSAAFPGLSFGAGHMGCITVFDIDADGRSEILFGNRRGDSKRIWCLEPSGRGNAAPVIDWMFPPIEEEGLPGDPISKVSIVDLEGRHV